MDVYEEAKAKALANGNTYEHAVILARDAQTEAWRRDDRAAAIRKEAAADAARPPQSSGWLTRMFTGWGK